MVNTYLTQSEAWRALLSFRGFVSYDVSMKQWAKALPCVFFHQAGNVCLRVTGYVDIGESDALAMCEQRNADLRAAYVAIRRMFPMLSAVLAWRAITQPKVELVLEDWGDEDRRLMMLNMYRGTESLGFFDTYAQAKEFADKHGLTIQPS